jgi:hypothetical protein
MMYGAGAGATVTKDQILDKASMVVDKKKREKKLQKYQKRADKKSTQPPKDNLKGEEVEAFIEKAKM